MSFLFFRPSLTRQNKKKGRQRTEKQKKAHLSRLGVEPHGHPLQVAVVRAHSRAEHLREGEVGPVEGVEGEVGDLAEGERRRRKEREGNVFFGVKKERAGEKQRGKVWGEKTLSLFLLTSSRGRSDAEEEEERADSLAACGGGTARCART